MANSRKTSRDRIKSNNEAIPRGSFINLKTKKEERDLISCGKKAKEPRYSGNTKSWYI